MDRIIIIKILRNEMYLEKKIALNVVVLCNIVVILYERIGKSFDFNYLKRNIYVWSLFADLS